MAADPGGVDAATGDNPTAPQTISRRAWLASLIIALLVIGGFGALMAYRWQQSAAHPQAQVTASGGSGNLTAGSPCA